MVEISKPSENLTHEEMASHLEKMALKKLNYSWIKSLILSIFGGVFISFGAIFATVINAGSSAIPFGIVRFLMGLVFSLGLILVIIGGAELFTGSTIVSVAVANKKANLWQVIKNLARVYLGNFIGSLLIAVLLFLAKSYTLGGGLVGISAINIALSKLHHTFLESVSLGILCNFLVCLAIWLTYSTKSVAGKIISLIFPIALFVAAGFEHSVANMYFIPIAGLIKIFDPGFVSNISVADLTISHFLINNLLPVTIGNIIGGVTIWLTFNWLYKDHA